MISVNKKKLLINQPGANGDILICLPIAKWYSKNFTVHWQCPKKYHLNFRNIEYCKPVEVYSGEYDSIIDLSFGIYIDTPLHKWWMRTKPQWQSFIIPKYILADVPVRERWNLTWIRNKAREEKLYRIITDRHGTEYFLCHGASHDGSRISMEFPNAVPFEPVDDFNVFDWYKVISNTREIHCIDSSLCNFVEVIPEFLQIRKVYYLSPKVPNLWDRTILTNNWEIVE